MLKMKREQAMSNRALISALVLCLFLPLPTWSQDEDVKASASVSTRQDQATWAGQQVTINLDLKTSGFSFSDTHFNLPEVSGGFLMQTDSTTIKLSEKKDGRDWQVLRYPLAFYPQKSGQLTIPAINVRFSSSAGFGSEKKSFELETEPLTLTVSLPPGVGNDEMVVTTRSFQLDHSWQPVKANEKTAIAKTGDAFTLTVNRRASDISAMLLPPLPVYRTRGLAAYPQTPEVEDKTNRGDLVGERTDSITWVVEEAGIYEIPGIRFKWWNPAKQELEQQLIPGLTLDVVGSSPGENETLLDDGSESKPRSLLPWTFLVLAGIIAVVVWRRHRTDVEGTQLSDEKSTFADLSKACKNNQAGKAHAAVYAWLGYCPPLAGMGSGPATLGEFSQIMKDDQLAEELLKLQQAIISTNPDWHGQSLLVSLRRVRRQLATQKRVHSKAHLAPLNP